jgi:hypothetical protein
MDNGMVIENEFSLGLFYTGNIVFGRVLPLSIRKFLSKIFGSATRVFLLKNNNQ